VPAATPSSIILTTFDANEHVLRALRAGAAGFVLKDTPPAEIGPTTPACSTTRSDPAAWTPQARPATGWRRPLRQASLSLTRAPVRRMAPS
jgi:hypothetical protein